MIVVTGQGCGFEGRKIDLMAEVILTLSRMKQKGAIDDDDIDLIAKVAKTPEEEIKKAVDDAEKDPDFQAFKALFECMDD